MQVLPLLLLAMLTSWLTSRMAQPDLTKRQLSGILTSINQADGRYKSLLRELENAQGQVKATEDRCAACTAFHLGSCICCGVPALTMSAAGAWCRPKTGRCSHRLRHCNSKPG